MSDLEPAKVDGQIREGDGLPFAPDLTEIHVPGHSEGQVAFHLERNGGVLITADTCVRRRGIQLPVAAEARGLKAGRR